MFTRLLGQCAGGQRAGGHRVLGAAVLVLVATSACSTASGSPTPSSPVPSAVATTTAAPVDLSGRYVAMGDSYSAGPGITPTDPESALCLRSEANFPSLLASQRATTLVDVSCAGASTRTATAGADGLTGFIPPQLDEVTADTDLVTVQLGGNDGGLFQTLLQACSQDATTCEQYVDGQAPAILTQTTGSVAALLDTVRSRAPQAEIVLVGYLRLSPTSGSCAALGLDRQAQDTVRSAEASLDDALATAAVSADVTFVSMRAASEGHDACAGDDAWTNGASASNGDGIVFHPRSAGMQAVATEIARVLA